MSHEFIALLRFTCIILIPLVPAFLLFKAIPSQTANVSGTLQGMHIKLGGAFAGYFALLLLIWMQYGRLFPAPVTYQVWELSGKVTDGTGQPIRALTAGNIHLTPASVQTFPDGTFRLNFYTMPDPAGNFDFPMLNVQIDDFVAPTIPLDSSEIRAGTQSIAIQKDEAKRRITIAQIPLAQAAAYNPTGPPPSPAPSPATIQ